MNLLNEHYQLIRQRGMIQHDTDIFDFMEKMEEEYRELMHQWAEDVSDHTSPSGEFWHEMTDIVMVCFNAMRHYGEDPIEWIKKNVELQKTRV